MKILSLNVWGGKLWEDLLPFLQQHALDTDIFCLQEVTSSTEHRELGTIDMAGNPRFSDLFEMLTVSLPHFTGIYGRELRDMNGNDEGAPVHYGNALFLSERLSGYEYREMFCYGAEEDRSQKIKAYDYSSRILQTVVLKNPSLAVHHLHGVWAKGSKTEDNPGRIEQSNRINGAMAGLPMPQVLCGDLNLWPDTESLRVLNDGRRNLILENGITGTIVKHSGGNGYADYVIVTPDVPVSSFEVLPDVVSDHLAMVLEI